MTLRYCLLAQGRKIRSPQGIDWQSLIAVVPIDTFGNEILPKSEVDALVLGARQVVRYNIIDGVMYAEIEKRKQEE